MSTTLKALVVAAAATASLAFAQGTPPNPSVANPAQGAGQRSSQNTPMGTTGTPGNGGAMAQGTMGTGSASTAASTTAGASAGSSTTMASSDSMGSKSMTKHTSKKHKKHAAKTDRN
ncbi:proteophosphoglycan ppg4 [Ramlibacter agri]|uniref:proteophosphoglycan ppg4 n=1 Tax=Ramlibacter agri TaxID=2728837 RepID=UPI00197DE724|nr:proteophosphoglycan ppg4 [Ramlibacter agri]